MYSSAELGCASSWRSGYRRYLLAPQHRTVLMTKGKTLFQFVWNNTFDRTYTFQTWMNLQCMSLYFYVIVIFRYNRGNRHDKYSFIDIISFFSVTNDHFLGSIILCVFFFSFFPCNNKMSFFRNRKLSIAMDTFRQHIIV